MRSIELIKGVAVEVQTYDEARGDSQRVIDQINNLALDALLDDDRDTYLFAQLRLNIENQRIPRNGFRRKSWLVIGNRRIPLPLA
jgi:hypothetical protein